MRSSLIWLGRIVVGFKDIRLPIIQRLLPVPLVVALLLTVALGATPARAAGVVTDCTETGLANAMNAGGGLITFDCGPNPVVIPMTLQNGGLNVISGRADTIDGGDKVTLDGEGAQRLFDVRVGGALTLTHIILTNGYAAKLGNLPDWGGAVLDEGNLLVLDHVTIRDSQSAYLGGAIRVVTGTAFITDSLLENNQSGWGGAIDGLGAVTLINTIVRGNTANAAGGGGFSLGGLTTVDHSQIYSNTAAGVGGAGLYLSNTARATILDSQIYSNTATNLLGAGGGLFNEGLLTLTNVSLNDNRAYAGGGLLNASPGQAALDHVSVSGNTATAGGYGGGLASGGTLSLTDTSVSGNRALANGTGAGLSLGGLATAIVTNSTFSGNTANAAAGIDSEGGPLTLTNVTLSSNRATTGDGGGLFAAHGPITLTSVTFSGNSAAGNGGAIYYKSAVAGTLTLKNTLVADSPAGGNCYVDLDSADAIASAGYNLSTDSSCATDFIKTGDQNGQPALLWPLANNGGFTLTHLPQHDSRVIDHGAGLGCPATDQRGQPRPVGICDIGAVEVQAADLAWPLFLPVLRR